MKENQINLQLWVERDFKKKVEETALRSGFPRWQSYVETLLYRAVNGDVKLELTAKLIDNGKQHEPA